MAVAETLQPGHPAEQIVVATRPGLYAVAVMVTLNREFTTQLCPEPEPLPIDSDEVVRLPIIRQGAAETVARILATSHQSLEGGEYDGVPEVKESEVNQQARPWGRGGGGNSRRRKREAVCQNCSPNELPHAVKIKGSGICVACISAQPIGEAVKNLQEAA